MILLLWCTLEVTALVPCCCFAMFWQEWHNMLASVPLAVVRTCGWFALIKRSFLPVRAAQATILLLFNESGALSYGDIQAAIKLEDSELRRTLASLTLAKER